MWQPIETAPKDGSDILVFSAWSEQQFVAFWHEKDWTALIQHDGTPYTLGGISDWMPLPSAPE